MYASVASLTIAIAICIYGHMGPLEALVIRKLVPVAMLLLVLSL